MSGSRESLRGYFQAVDRRYSALRGVPCASSPRDVEQIVAWFEEGVPLPLVLRVLDELEESHARGSRAAEPVRSLRFARKAVEKRFREHRLLAPGAEPAAAPGFSSAWLRRELQALGERYRASRLGGVAPAALEAALARIAALEAAVPAKVGARGVDEIEKGLGALDAELLELLRAAAPDALRDARAQAEEAMESFRGLMPPRAFDEAVAARAAAGMRQQLQVPRASLFGGA